MKPGEIIERLEKLERLFDQLCDALERQGTEQDGDWGWPPFRVEIAAIRRALAEREG